MLLKVSLVDDPTGLQIANWLKSFSPKNIRAVDIEGLVLKARTLEGLKEHQTLFPGSLLGSLSESAQKEIAERLRDLSDVVSNTATTAALATAATTTATSVRSRSPAVLSNTKNVEKALNSIETTVSDLCAIVESNLLLDPNVDLKSAARDEVAIAVGAGDAISLRQYLLNRNLIPEKTELPSETIIFTDPDAEDSPRFRYADVSGTSVIVESFEYGFMVSSEDEDPPAGTAKQFKTMVTQLSQPKRTSFHILPCVGYIHERSAQRFGLVFELGAGLQDCGHKTLFDSFSATKRVPLGHRIHLSHALAVAVENFHRVGWVHKELRSQNIVFFAFNQHRNAEDRTKQAYLPELGVDFSKPYLFGFEYSRPDDAETSLMPDFSTETNVYRHPERWGKPGVRFTKPHDIYALVCVSLLSKSILNILQRLTAMQGVILFELARWQTAISFAGSHPRMDPWKLKEKLLAEAKKNLPHRVGQVFSDAIAACLDFEQSTRGFSEIDMHNAFKTDVLERLRKVVGNV
jgi:hypothetical protein